MFVAVDFYLLHEPLDNWPTNPGTGLRSGGKREIFPVPGWVGRKGVVMETSESQVRAGGAFGECGQVMSAGGNPRRTGPLLLGTESGHVSPGEGGRLDEGMGKIGLSLRAADQVPWQSKSAPSPCELSRKTQKLLVA